MTDATMACKKKECETERRMLDGELNAMNTKLKRVQTELRITKILNEDLNAKLDTMRDELLDAQTKVYTTSQTRRRMLEYINWIDEYKTESSSRVVSTKFVRDHLL